MGETTCKRHPHTRYHAYLLRIWQVDGAAVDAGWQASLQDATTNQRIGFACLEELFAFLMNEAERDQRLVSGDKGDKSA